MAFKDFSNTQYIRLVEANENVRMGTFKVQESGELVYIRTMMVLFNTPMLTGLEQAKMHVYTKDYYAGLIATSETIDLIDVGYDTSMHSWIGFVRFTFANQNINKNITYYPSIEFIGNASTPTHYIGVNYDFPAPVYDNGSARFYQQALAHQIFLKR